MISFSGLVFIGCVIVVVIALLLASRFYRGADLSQFDSPVPPLMKKPADISAAHQQVVTRLANYQAQPATKSIEVGRERFEALFAQQVDAEIRSADAGGVAAEWVLADGADPQTRLLYLHGGAFMVGSPKSHRFITAELSKNTGAAVLSIDYRMLPEHKLVHCHEDARRAYRFILDNGPDGPSSATSVFVAGDSAGGNSTLSLMNWVRNQGLRKANAAVTFAPLTDGTMSSPTWEKNLATDYFLGPSIGKALKVPALIRAIAGHLQSGKPAHDPALSPVFDSLDNLPDTLIQVSQDEMLFGDAVRYTNKASSEGSSVELQIWPTLVHVFQGFPELPESTEALVLAGEFIRARKTQTEN